MEEENQPTTSLDDEHSSVTESSARSSVFNAANQSLSQQELTDIMFASVRNPAAKLGFGGKPHAVSGANNKNETNGHTRNEEDEDDGSNVGILTAMA